MRAMSFASVAGPAAVPTSVLRAVSYARNSVHVTQSMRGQLDTNRAACERYGWSMVAELSDGSSASRYATKTRDNWAELLRLLPEVDVVVFTEASRGDRTLGTWVAFLDRCRDAGTLIHATIRTQRMSTR